MKTSKETFAQHYANQMNPSKSEAETDMELRGREMAADPMLEYFREKEREKHGNKDVRIYKGLYPPNRYNIRPGYRWDGVDRSNGYERKLMEKEAHQRANEEESFRNATRDL